MPTESEAKKAIDKIIKKSRVHFYKPIQIAEILYNHRTKRGYKLNDLESYRNISKRWRDEISMLLVGRKSTSSQKYQDNLFEPNAVPPELIAKLGAMNKKNNGSVEAYIYKSLEKRLSSVFEIEEHIRFATPDNFSVKEVVGLFRANPGLKRSTDKIYEILVYALFSTIVRALRVQVSIEVGNVDKEILRDFDYFIKTVVGVEENKTRVVVPAALYRVGVTNAADRGLDMWSNFGAAIQVKHLTLKPEDVEGIAENITADRIVIVCLNSEKDAIEKLLQQVGWGDRIQGIITVDDLHNWYGLCLSKKYRSKLSGTLLKDVEREFFAEFPSSQEIKPFMKGRGYDKVALPNGWKVI